MHAYIHTALGVDTRLFFPPEESVYTDGVLFSCLGADSIWDAVGYCVRTDCRGTSLCIAGGGLSSR